MDNNNIKIGIITFHRAVNYGAVLQTWALEQYLISKGFKVEIVDYRNKHIEDHYEPFNLLTLFHKRRLITFLKYLIFYNLNTGLVIKRNLSFSKFLESNLIITSTDSQDLNNLLKDFDALICGSDQIWNPILTGGWDKIYFLKFDKKMKCIKMAYAVSMGNLSKIKNRENIKDIKNKLKDLDYISVRESGMIKLLKQYTNKQIITTIDPTLLIDQKMYGKLGLANIIEEPYIFVFQVVKDKRAMLLAKRIAQKEGLRIIQLLSGLNNLIFKNRIIQTCGPVEFLNLIKYSSYVITTSFHGTALSIVFKKNFFTINTGSSERQGYLLKSLDLDSRYVNNINKINIDEMIDYNRVFIKFEQHKKRSCIFLNKLSKNCNK
ncbi:MAG: polysaccharide pyruvyl transferase family protein [candidate division KSB1 bacterium]|nr:polysaccharide pyruvyl transferase family protein [candidate division KSB1 bacterium]